MAQYRVGTISTTAGSPNITGNNTFWLVKVKLGSILLIDGDGTPYRVVSVSDEGAMTINANYPKTLSDVPYVISIDFSPNRGYPLVSPGDTQAADVLREALLKIDADAQFGLAYAGSVLALATAPPGSPAGGDVYAVDAAATGAWASQDGQLATWSADDSAWTITPMPDRAYVYDYGTSAFLVRVGGLWQPWTINAGLDATGAKFYLDKPSDTYFVYEDGGVSLYVHGNFATSFVPQGE